MQNLLMEKAIQYFVIGYPSIRRENVSLVTLAAPVSLPLEALLKLVKLQCIKNQHKSANFDGISTNIFTDSGPFINQDGVGPVYNRPSIA